MKSDQIAFGILLFVVSVSIIWAFSSLPYDQPGQAKDWKLYHRATSGLRIEYEANRVYNPPWVMALLWPFTVFPLHTSRGLWALATLTIFVICIPRTSSRLWMLSVVLLIFSYPMLRHLMDGNLEAVVVGGVVLVLYALHKRSLIWLAISLVFLSAKIQETWLFLVVFAVILWINWPWGAWIKSVLAAGLFAALFFIWKGTEWLEALRSFPYSGTSIDSSLHFVLTRVGFNGWVASTIWAAFLAITLWLAFRTKPELNLVRAGFLVTAGLMLSNYAAGDSLVTPLALGAIPLFQKKTAVGLALITLFFAPYLFISNIEFRLEWENVYWAGVLVITWCLLGWEILNRTKRASLPA